jgi:dUTP pyrophosphatase
MKLEIVKIKEDVTLPEKATPGSAMYDIYAAEDAKIPPRTVRKISTGIKVAIPKGYKMLLYPRSSMGMKAVNLANGVGVIDSDYRGEIMVILHNLSDEDFIVLRGARIAQMEVVPVGEDLDFSEVEELGTTERGEGGFGHTGV